MFQVAINSTIITTALPTIVSELQSSSGYAWVGGAYILAKGATSPIYAKLSDIWGRKIVLLVGCALYLGSSILCATAPSMAVLITARAIQGSAGGCLNQLVNITISDLFSLK